jgi:hypothetical protein
MSTTNENNPIKVGDYILNNSLSKISVLSRVNIIADELIEKNSCRYEDIDVGVSGIILFLMELYRIFPERKYKKAIFEAGEDLLGYCRDNSRVHFGFYKGRGGVCYTLLRLSDVTGDKKFMNYAVELIKDESQIFIQSEFASNCLYDGRSGLLFVLLHLYASNPEDWILEKINLCINLIIKAFLVTEDGIVWNKFDLNIKPLNSFLYGSSGLVFAILQVAEYFNNTDLLTIGMSILNNDDTLRKSKASDFKKEIRTYEDFQIHKFNYKNKNFNFFLKPSVNKDWANGFAGLCLPRLQILRYQNNIQKKLVNQLIWDLNITNSQNKTLATGLAGIGSVLIEVSKYGYDYLWEKIHEIGESLNINKTQNISLFYGSTGVGYFMLQHVDHEDFNSVLYPKIRKKNAFQRSSKESKSEFIANTLKSTFPLTFLTIQVIAPDHYARLIRSDFNKNCDYVCPKILMNFKSTIETNLPKNYLPLILDVFKLELAKIRMFSKTKSYSFNYIKERMKFEDKIALMNMEIDDELLKQTLLFEKEIKIVNTKWNWALLNQPGADLSKIISEFKAIRPERIKLILYFDSNNKIVEDQLDTFGELTLSIFSSPQTANESINRYIDAFEINNEQDLADIISYSKKYIKYYIKKSLLYRSLN